MRASVFRPGYVGSETPTRPAKTGQRIVSLLFHDVYDAASSESGFLGPAADRYKLTLGEFEAQLTSLSGTTEGRPILVTELPEGDGQRVPIAITVDDGGASYYTRVADRLEARGWRGHCFITTSLIGQPGFLDSRRIRELRARGHLIGSHSVSHPRRFAACPWEEMVREWRESREALEDILGEPVTVASVPGGCFAPRVAWAAHEAGIGMLFTSEPETRVHRLGGCLVIGRFTVRRGCAPDFSRKIAVREPVTILREWVSWNAKKMAKAVLRDAYPRLAEGGLSGVGARARSMEDKSRCA